MPQTTQKRLGVNMGVQLKGPRSKHRIDPYNMFTIHYTVTTTTVNSKELKREEGERTLSNPWLLGLNPAWLSRRAPDSRAANKSQKATIRSFIPNFPYWGYLIDHSIQEFNASSPHRCRKLVYDLRHGEADHNAWKKLYIERDEEFRWTKNPEYKTHPIIQEGGKDYCIIDPPLTAKGEEQAGKANDMFLQLREHMFPMPKRAYVSPLLRAMQTFELALKGIEIGTDNSYILNDLREKQTGNCADILIDEYISRSKRPRKPRTNVSERYEETNEDVQRRAARLQGDICAMDDSDCIVRVTHSLLIQQNLRRLESGGRKLLQKFMLAEGGLFAYVIEESRPDQEMAETLRNRHKKVKDRMKERGPRRETAFKDLKAPTKPIKVTIEQAILDVKRLGSATA